MKGITGRLAAGQAPVCRYAAHNVKFEAEKVCAENERYLVHFDGILLNHAKPVQDGERFEMLTGLYEQYGAEMTAHLKGQYNLVIRDKLGQKTLVTNDLLSRRPMYYCVQEKCLFYAAGYNDLLELLGEENAPLSFSAEAVERMALTGALGGTQTYVKEASYLAAYQTIVFDERNGSTEMVTVQPLAAPSASTTEEAAAVFDRLFTAAVKAQFDKNIEYGYDQRMALSGGMDSRACLLKAVACGYDREITCVTYSQTGSIDENVSRQIAFDNRLDYVFYPMDAAVFMTRLQDAMRCNECQQSSIGSTGARTMARLLDQTRSGIMHVGLCGGELMGDLVTAQGSGMRSLLMRLGLAGTEGMQFALDSREYLDHLRACQNFTQMFLDGCETVSPFMDEDVVQFVRGVEPALLYRRSLYREWMKKYIPNPYPTTYFCGPITISPVREAGVKLANALVKRVFGVSKRDMNPMELWLKTRPDIAEECRRSFEAGMEEIQKAGLAASALDAIRQSWQCGGEAQFYALTAIQAVREILERFAA